MASPVMVETMKSLGATGVPVAWAELYTALQTGVVDGAENNHPSVVAKKFYEVSKYYTLDEHMRIPDLIAMSMKLYDQLNDDQKKAVLEAGARTQAYMRGAWKISELKDLQELKAKFTQIITPDKTPFVEAVAPMVKEEAKRLGSKRRSPSSSIRRKTSDQAGLEATINRAAVESAALSVSGGMCPRGILWPC
jgi:TRAP-type C4-dicarboxylate transport system, periplasmic component